MKIKIMKSLKQMMLSVQNYRPPRLKGFTTNEYKMMCIIYLKKLLKPTALFLAVILGLYLIFRNKEVRKSKVEIRLWDANQRLDNQACVHPHLELWPPGFKEVFKPLAPLKCADEENWVLVNNGLFQISKDAITKHGDIQCDYIPKLRKDEYTTVDGDTIENIRSGTPLPSDFFEVKCKAKDGTKYTNIHPGIMHNDTIHQRAKSKDLPTEALGLNILVFAFDSMSRMTWMRNLPETHDYLVNSLGGMVLEGYNIVGDGTPQALLPMLTGKTERELPEARRGEPSAKPVDEHPWIWKKLKDIGYVTQWAEDLSYIAAFTYRMLGFEHQPVDHYMRTFYVVTDKKYSWIKSWVNTDQDKYCYGSTPSHMNMLKWGQDFFDMYDTNRKFSFFFHAEYSHEGNSQTKWADKDLVQFLKDMENKGHLNNTLLIFGSDHGARFQSLRYTLQGKFEERMPYFAIRLPPWFQLKYPEAMKNVHINTHRLTTPFDIHATFLDLINFSASGKGNVNERGISLFKEIPAERTCKDADIESHWCGCLQWEAVSVNSSVAQRAATSFVNTVNSYLYIQTKECEELTLKTIKTAAKYTPSENLLKHKKSLDADGLKPDLSDTITVPYTLYQIQVITSPGDGFFEVTLKHILEKDTFEINMHEISRINKYGLQPHCLMKEKPALRPFCYCKIQLKNTSKD